MTKEEIDYIKLRLKKDKARKSHLHFIDYTWQKKTPFQIGRHTRTICHYIDEAIEDLKAGKSTYLCIEVHPRAGKSEILSQKATAHFIGQFPDNDVMICCYNSSLAEKNSRFAQNVVLSKEFQELYPNTKVRGGVAQWGIEGRQGLVTASGILSGITGNGYVLGMLDDYFAGRADAESQTIRDKAWGEFTDSFLTRKAPVSITIVLATQWHDDDIIGRIKKKVDPNDKEYDPDFPPFKIVSFPAEDGEADVWKKAEKTENGEIIPAHWEHEKWKWLFPERFDETFYLQQKASVGSYSWASLYQCNPQIRGGNLIKGLDKIHYHDSLSEFPQGRFSRVWDLAHTAKQRISDDPDFTSGTLLLIRTNKEGQDELWVKDVSRFRENATARDNMIRALTDKDGAFVDVAIERSIESKDAYIQLKDILNGKRIVKQVPLKGDKVTRFAPLEPIFEAGNVHILRASWNADWLAELSQFPNGKHDDQVDNLSAGYIHQKTRTSKVYSSVVRI